MMSRWHSTAYGNVAAGTAYERTVVPDAPDRSSGAAVLERPVRAVEKHVANIYAKIGARGRADAATYALRHGLAPDMAADP